MIAEGWQAHCWLSEESRAYCYTMYG